MNRISQVLADKCSSILAGMIANSQAIDLERLNFRASLKYLIAHDPNISVEIISPDGFDVYDSRFGTVIPNGPAISEARVSDFLLGAIRVKNQYESLQQMKAGGANSAWLLVTAYYCAFFSCIEICKLLDRISFSLDDNDMATLSYKAIGPHHAQFFGGTQKNFVGTQYAGMLRFRAVGTKPHKAAWENVRVVFSQIFSSKGWVDANRYIEILSDDEYSPSRIRNIWNYARSDYYGETGESIAENFTKLVGNPRGAFGWLVNRQQKLDSLDPSIIAVLCESLAAAVLNASERAGILVSEKANI